MGSARCRLGQRRGGLRSCPSDRASTAIQRGRPSRFAAARGLNEAAAAPGAAEPTAAEQAGTWAAAPSHARRAERPGALGGKGSEPQKEDHVHYRCRPRPTDQKNGQAKALQISCALSAFIAAPHTDGSDRRREATASSSSRLTRVEGTAPIRPMSHLGFRCGRAVDTSV